MNFLAMTYWSFVIFFLIEIKILIKQIIYEMIFSIKNVNCKNGNDYKKNNQIYYLQ